MFDLELCVCVLDSLYRKSEESSHETYNAHVLIQEGILYEKQYIGGS